MSLGRVVRGSRLPGPDGPNRFIGQEDSGTPCPGEDGKNRIQLAQDHLLQTARSSLLQLLPHTDDRDQPRGEGRAHLQRHLLVGLSEEVAALGVPDEGVGGPRRPGHGGRNLTGEGSRRFPVDVLDPYSDLRVSGKGHQSREEGDEGGKHQNLGAFAPESRSGRKSWKNRRTSSGARFIFQFPAIDGPRPHDSVLVLLCPGRRPPGERIRRGTPVRRLRRWRHG